MSKKRREPLKHLVQPDWSVLRKRLETILKLKGQDELQTLLLDRYLPPLPVLYNWAPLYRGEREEFRADHGPSVFKGTSRRAAVLDFIEEEIIVDPETEEEHLTYTRLARCTLPDDVEAFLTVFVPVADFKVGRDIKRVMDPVRRLVREAIAECPTPEEARGMRLVERPLVLTDSIGPPAPWIAFHIAVSGLQGVNGIMREFEQAFKAALRTARPTDSVGIVPPEWRFLLHAQEVTFKRDLEWYRLYQVEGYSVRQIAFLEEQKRLGKPVHDPPPTIGREVQNESGVWESIARIYEAVHGRPLDARRRRLDTPAEGVAPYHCETHGTRCPRGCPTLQRWWEIVQQTLPTDAGGWTHGEVKARTEEEWERWTDGDLAPRIPSLLDQEEEAEREAWAQQHASGRAVRYQQPRYQQARALLYALTEQIQGVLLAHFGPEPYEQKPFHAKARGLVTEAMRSLRAALGVGIPYPPTDGSRCVPAGCGCPLPPPRPGWALRGFDFTQYRDLPTARGLKDPWRSLDLLPEKILSGTVRSIDEIRAAIGERLCYRHRLAFGLEYVEGPDTGQSGDRFVAFWRELGGLKHATVVVRDGEIREVGRPRSGGFRDPHKPRGVPAVPVSVEALAEELARQWDHGGW